MSNFVSARFGYSTLTLTMCAPIISVNEHTNPSAVTTDCTQGIGSRSIDGDKLGNLLPYRGCSTRDRTCTTSVFLARRPAAERAADARRLRSAGFPLVLKFAVWNDDRIDRDRTHARYYDLHSDSQ